MSPSLEDALGYFINPPPGDGNLTASGDQIRDNLTLARGFVTEISHHFQRDKGDTPAIHMQRPGLNDRFQGPVGSDVDPTKNMGSTPAQNTIGLLTGNPYATKIGYANGTQAWPRTTVSLTGLPAEFPSSGRIGMRFNDGNTYMQRFSSNSVAGVGGTGTLGGLVAVPPYTDVPAGVAVNGGALVSLIEDTLQRNPPPAGAYASKPAQINSVTTEDANNNGGVIQCGTEWHVLTTPHGNTSPGQGPQMQSAVFRDDGALDYVARAMGFYFTGAQSIPQNVPTTILWDTTDWADAFDAWYNPATGLYTPAMTGLYRVEAQLQFTTSFAANAAVTPAILRTGSQRRIRPEFAQGFSETFCISSLVDIDASVPDTIGLQVQHGAAAAKTLVADRRFCWMQIQYVGRTTAIQA